MKNTPENKAKFFAQYWGQKVMRSKEWAVHEGSGCILVNPTYSPAWTIWYLKLKPLSQITDEDAIEVAEILLQRSDLRLIGITEEGYSVGYSAGNRLTIFDDGSGFKAEDWAGEALTELCMDEQGYLRAFDFFRSKGYALPWMGISVEQQIEWGWIRLTSQVSNLNSAKQ